MNMTRRTFYGIGVVSALLNILGGVMLIFGVRANLLFNVATIGAGSMMLLLASTWRQEKAHLNICLLGGLLTVLGIMPGVLGALCAAASWPVFAWQFFKASGEDEPLHKISFLVMICGIVLLIGSFLPVPQMLAACIILAVSAAQGLLVYLLYRDEPAPAQK